MNEQKKKRNYTDREKGAAIAWLDACGGDVSKAARQLEIPRTTLREWADGRNQSVDVANLRQEEKKNLALKLDDVMYELIDVTPDEVKSGKLNERFTSFGIAFDKRQLLAGKPTAINETRSSENRAWAEEQLAILMKEFALNRDEAIELARRDAPTVAEWVM